MLLNSVYNLTQAICQKQISILIKKGKLIMNIILGENQEQREYFFLKKIKTFHRVVHILNWVLKDDQESVQQKEQGKIFQTEGIE